MAARVSAWRDPASEQQVARWFAEQEALGRGGKHANVLEKTGVVRKPQLPKRPQSARPVMGGGNAEAAAARSKRPQSAHPSRKPALPTHPENSAAGPAIEVKATKATIDEPVKVPQRPKSAHPSSKSRSYSMKELLGDEAGEL